MSGTEPGILEQYEGDAVVEMSRESSGVRKASLAEAPTGNLPPAGNRLQSQERSSKPLVPTGRKPSSDGSVSGASRHASSSSLKASSPAGSNDATHLPTIGSGRSTPSRPSVTPPAAPPPVRKPRGIPKPSSQGPARTESDAPAASPTAAIGRGRAADRRVSRGASSASAQDSDQKPPGNDGDVRTAKGRGGGGEALSARDASPGRDPREAGWNSSPGQKASAQQAAAVRRDIKLSSPSEEERRKRVEWVRNKRRREEAKAREEAERRQAEENRRREEEQERLEARRAAIRDRIQKQHEVAAKMAQERAKADEAARGAIGRFLASKPLHQRLKEDYEKQQAELEAEKKRQYDEEIRNRQVRPHQIISGEVQIKPHNKPDAVSNGGAADRNGPIRSPSHSRGSGGGGGGGGSPTAAAGNAGAASRSVSGRGRVSSRLHAPASDGASSPASPSGQPPSHNGGGVTAAEATVAAADSAQAGRPPKLRIQGPTLTSTSSKSSRRVINGLGALSRRGHLVDRASSPFVFTDAGIPINVPPQTNMAASGSEVLQVDATLAAVTRESSSVGVLAVAAAGGAAAAEAGLAAAVARSCNSRSGAVSPEDSGDDSGLRGGHRGSEYTPDDDVPQMQSPLDLASSGAEATYESEGAQEPKGMHGVWGSDAADTDVDSPGKVGAEKAWLEKRDSKAEEQRQEAQEEPEEGQQTEEDDMVGLGSPEADVAASKAATEGPPAPEPESDTQDTEPEPQPRIKEVTEDDGAAAEVEL
ncbi:hypothetical protein Vretifemale_20262, partial [Volvox reticuliferus]